MDANLRSCTNLVIFRSKNSSWRQAKIEVMDRNRSNYKRVWFCGLILIAAARRQRMETLKTARRRCTLSMPQMLAEARLRIVASGYGVGFLCQPGHAAQPRESAAPVSQADLAHTAAHTRPVDQ